MKILVEMAFAYGDQKFSSGPQECNDIDVIRHMRRLGYGTVIKDEAVVEETVEAVVPVKEEPVKEKPVRKRTTRKKAKK